jgi:dUTP pyrophosphatase
MGGSTSNIYMVPYRLLTAWAKAPAYSSAEAAGADLYADLSTLDTELMETTIQPGKRLLVKTGVAIELPTGSYAKIEGRSGLANKHGICVLGGVIDSDYRGDVGVILLNTGEEPFTFKHGDRIAQLVIHPYLVGHFEEADALTHSDRGAAGFGSSGS